VITVFVVAGFAPPGSVITLSVVAGQHLGLPVAVSYQEIIDGWFWAITEGRGSQRGAHRRSPARCRQAGRGNLVLEFEVGKAGKFVVSFVAR